MRTIRFGIIGLGVIAVKFADALARTEGVRLEAVASREQARSDRFAAEHGAARSYGSYEDLLRDPDVDAVYIAVTHNLHAEVARRCIEAGKPVLCEKPFFIGMSEAEPLVRLARERGILMMEAMWTRCLPAFRQAKAWVDEGRIGEVRLIQASFCFNVMNLGPDHRLFNPALAGGSLWDAGVYPIEFATGIIGRAPTVVRAAAALNEAGVDLFVAMSLGFEGGALASLSCGLTARTGTDALICGTEGQIVVYNFLGTQKTERFDGAGALAERYEEPCDNGFIYEIRHFADLLRNGDLDSPWIPLRDTLDCARIFDEARAQF